MSTTTKVPASQKQFTSSILLWMRSDKPRQAGMDHWSGPHSGIIAATPGLAEYRQVHLEPDGPGRWPTTPGLETSIPTDRRVDGIAEVTFTSPLSPLIGRKQTQLAYADEVNVFRRTLLHAGPPGSTRWHSVGPGPVAARTVLFLRRSPDLGGRDLRRLVRRELVPALAATGALTELRTQVFLPWNVHTWNTPDVAHDNPAEHHLHASLTLGFADTAQRSRFDAETAPALSDMLRGKVAAAHAYHVEKTLTFVEDGRILPAPHL